MKQTDKEPKTPKSSPGHFDYARQSLRTTSNKARRAASRLRRTTEHKADEVKQAVHLKRLAAKQDRRDASRTARRVKAAAIAAEIAENIRRREASLVDSNIP